MRLPSPPIWSRTGARAGPQVRRSRAGPLQAGARNRSRTLRAPRAGPPATNPQKHRHVRRVLRRRQARRLRRERRAAAAVASVELPRAGGPRPWQRRRACAAPRRPPEGPLGAWGPLQAKRSSPGRAAGGEMQAPARAGRARQGIHCSHARRDARPRAYLCTNTGRHFGGETKLPHAEAPLDLRVAQQKACMLTQLFVVFLQQRDLSSKASGKHFCQGRNNVPFLLGTGHRREPRRDGAGAGCQRRATSTSCPRTRSASTVSVRRAGARVPARRAVPACWCFQGRPVRDTRRRAGAGAHVAMQCTLE